ncbi:polyprenyl synthetase family protein [Microbacterium sp.]|uniref:polyprenyl synthetase family protein n=1 Tax=Microbacterium sp. TaxID=51671 RepID=UPI0028112635|nr:polyprenyl synthetase family protein [Microbacterium sp.]
MTGLATTAGQGVERTIGDFFAERIARGERLGQPHADLWRRAAEAADGGKRLRPRLLHLAHEHLGGEHRVDADTVAAALEVLHTALLMHDDVLDGDLVRRGRPNLAGRFAADAIEHGSAAGAAMAWGAASAILAGDVLISGVHALLARVEHPARAALHALVDDCLAVTAAGEHADVGLALGVISSDEAAILRMMEQKTACYSFAAPLQAGAMLAGASSQTLESLARIGAGLGLLYQMRDDVIGVFGTESRTGKTVIGDLREGKRTLLVAFAEDSADWPEVQHLFGRASLDENDAERLRAALVTSGATERMQATISAHGDHVRDAIAESELPGPLCDELTRIATECVERDA